MNFDREANVRFGFSFLYPREWDRKDPMNGDGNTYVNPKNPDVKILAWGSYAVLYENINEAVIKTIESMKREKKFKLLYDTESGRHAYSWEKENDEVAETREQVEGRRFVYQCFVDKKKITYMHLITQKDDIQFSIKCEAPSKAYSDYEDLFLHIVSSIHILV